MPTPVIPLAVDPENETLASALNNFILNFYGAIAKTVVNGEVVWILPCDLATGIPGYPRDPSLGTACYFKSIFETFGTQITDAEATALAAEVAAASAVATANAAALAAAGAQTSANTALALIAALGTLSAQNSNAISVTGGTIANTTVTGLPVPTGASDAATKSYADSLAGGIIPKQSCVLATTANITLSGEQTIDGTLTSGTRVLVKNQSSTQTNGIYVSAAGAWTRATDADTTPEVALNQYYFVSSGTTNGGTGWFISTSPATLGTNPLLFSQFSSTTNYSAGTGLILSGTQFSLNPNQSGLTLTASAFNGTIGATTPSTIVATAITASGHLNVSNTITATGNLENFASGIYSILGNNTVSTILGSVSNHPVLVFVNSATVGTFSSTGLSIPGILTAPVQRLTGYSGDVNQGIIAFRASTLTDYIYFNGSSISFGVGGAERWGISSSGVATSGTLNVGGASTLADVTGSVFTRTGASTNNSVWGVVSDATTYNMLTLNNVSSLAGMLGIAGGGGVDGTLYLKAPSGGGFNFSVNNASIAAVNGYGLAVNGGIQGTGIFNVRNYGALGDGSTNDTAAIVAAIAAAKAYHGAVYFPAGIYKTDTITITGAAGLTIYGDGMGVSKIKHRTAGQVLHMSSSSRVNIHDLTFDGSYTVRTAGGQAVFLDTIDYLTFSKNEIINSGEFALYIGDTSASNVLVDGNVIGLNWADGINLFNVTNYIVSNNRVTGADDDCIAVNGTRGLVIGNYVHHRSDSITGTGRGIWSGFNGTDIEIIGNVIDGVKTYGIYINQESTNKQTGIKAIGNTIVNTPLISGQPINFTGVKDCAIENNTVYDPPVSTSGLIEIANWDNLSVTANKLHQRTNSLFVRGIHVDEGTGFSDTTWSDLTIKNNVIYLTGNSTSNGIYLQPNAANTMDTVIIDSNTVKQRSGVGNYIQLAGTTTTMGKILNNSTMTAGETISPANGGIFTVQNNW